VPYSIFVIQVLYLKLYCTCELAGKLFLYMERSILRELCRVSSRRINRSFCNICHNDDIIVTVSDVIIMMRTNRHCQEMCRIVQYSSASACVDSDVIVMLDDDFNHNEIFRVSYNRISRSFSYVCHNEVIIIIDKNVIS